MHVYSTNNKIFRQSLSFLIDSLDTVVRIDVNESIVKAISINCYLTV